MKRAFTELNDLSDALRLVLNRAEEEARQFNHSFIGTEHLLLGLLAAVGGSVTSTLKTFGVEPGDIRRGIETQCPRGTGILPIGALPLTPRALRVVTLAIQHAKIWHQSQTNPEQLLLCLLTEPDGVAARVMLNLGVKPDELRREALKVRLEMAKIVERAVRPVLARTAAKRKMREELLSHLTSIYEEELQEKKEPDAALNAAAKRFGDPADLSRDLQRAQPLRERFGYRMERFMGWRAPESATRYMARVAAFQLLGMATAYIFSLGVATWRWGLPFGFTAVRPILAMTVMLPAAQFLIGSLYFMMRDAIWGVFGSRRSTSKAVLLATAIVASVVGCGFGFLLIGSGNLDRSEGAIESFFPAAVIAALLCYRVAATKGLTEIADTHWACLEI